MAGGQYDSSLTRVQPFFGALIASDPFGTSWLSKLLAATPKGAAVLGDLLDDPGTLLSPITSLNDKGGLGCFEYPVPPPRDLLAWFVEHPGELVWPKRQGFSAETRRLRRALIDDDPAGSRQEMQEHARTLVATWPRGTREWWRSEGTTMLDCALITDRLVVTIEGKRTEPLSPATDWYPKRSQLVRNLEAAKQLAHGRRWASLLISETPVIEGTDSHLDAGLPHSAPHLHAADRAQLHAAYLGNLSGNWPAMQLASTLARCPGPPTKRARETSESRHGWDTIPSRSAARLNAVMTMTCMPFMDISSVLWASGS